MSIMACTVLSKGLHLWFKLLDEKSFNKVLEKQIQAY